MFNVHEFLQKNAQTFTNLSDAIWEVPELYFNEKKSAQLTANALEEAGFEVTRNIAGLETALMGSYGNGPTVIAFLGEYDALPSLSQKGGVSTYEPIEANGHGHGCGHNLLGTGSFAAACALKKYIEETNAPVTLRFYGCPAEEAGSGKAHMTKAGIFDDVDLAISWHPMTSNGVMNMTSLANYAVKFKFYGKSAHAAAAPHLGRSALDAVELMNVGVNYLREHVEQEARIHYAITNSGGTAPNVVQAYAEVDYLIRAPRKKQVVDIFERVQKIAQGAALMTETKVEMEFQGAASDLIPNTILAKVMQDQLDNSPTLSFTEEDQQFAKEIYDSLDEASKASAYQFMTPQMKQQLQGHYLNHLVTPLLPEVLLPGSTDVGDVSWVTPTVQCSTACWVLGTPAHTWQVVAVGNTPIAHKGMLYAAEIMAKTAIACIENPKLIDEAKAELQTRLDGDVYQSLIPDNI
ncbi:M20 family metallopeptidase [Bacillus ndiopicus]|uniref:M20 family metallopeptidase n=1 Tax=Bacillus ndiopicus TaxID=1347368 RepID=UPI0005A71AF0|nr:M20 family metallopeptidase [Bacillus ndiopicus]